MALCSGNYSSFMEHKQRTLFEETIQEKYMKRMKKGKDLRNKVRLYLDKEAYYEASKAQMGKTRVVAAQRLHQQSSKLQSLTVPNSPRADNDFVLPDIT